MGDLLLVFWVVAPPIVGLMAITLAVILLRKPAGATVNTTERKIVGALCVLLALGIGACYGILFSGANF